MLTNRTRPFFGILSIALILIVSALFSALPSRSPRPGPTGTDASSGANATTLARTGRAPS